MAKDAGNDGGANYASLLWETIRAMTIRGFERAARCGPVSTHVAHDLTHGRTHKDTNGPGRWALENSLSDEPIRNSMVARGHQGRADQSFVIRVNLDVIPRVGIF